MSGAATPSLEGILHVHSTYSDGEFALAKLRGVLQAEGMRFACLADHAEAFDEAKVARYIEECAELSDAEFWFVPGLEFECEQRLHVVGYGCVHLTDSKNPEAVISHIRANAGLPVVAHPPDALFGWLEGFAVLPHGLEVWNAKYDGRYAPRASPFGLLKRWRSRGVPVMAFYGVDLHWRKQFRGLSTRVFAATPDPDGILGALAQGRFLGVHGDSELSPTGELDPHWLAKADARNRRSGRVRKFLKGGKRLMDKLGLRVPGVVKAELRRWF